MTIKFNCPKCGALIAFPAKYAGTRAKCLTCRQRFIIPANEFEKIQVIKPEREKAVAPLPGFYRAVFHDSWKLFVNPQNVTQLTFVVAVVCFKFFLAKGFCCMNYISAVMIWGWLIGFYMDVIDETASDNDTLPEIYLGVAATFFWRVISPFFVFFYTMFLVQVPLIVALALLRGQGVTFWNIWKETAGYNLLLQMLAISGLFVFPAAILTTAVGKDLTLLRPDYLLRPIIRGFVPYIVVVALLVAGSFLVIGVTGYTGADTLTTTRDLGLNIAGQVVAIIAMRSIGLFYRHYSCYFKW